MKPPPGVFFVSFREDNCLNETKGLITLLRFMVGGGRHGSCIMGDVIFSISYYWIGTMT